MRTKTQPKTETTYHCDLCDQTMPFSDAPTHLESQHKHPLDDIRKFKAQMSMHFDARDSYTSVYQVFDTDGDQIGTKTVVSEREKSDPMRFNY